MGNMFSAAIFVLLACVSAFIFVIYPGQIFVAYLLVKPIVDGFLEQGATIAGVTLSFSYLPSLIIPSLMIVLAAFQANRFQYLPFKGFVILYMFLNVVAYFKEGHFDIGTTGYYIRVIFPLFLYFSVPIFVESRQMLERMTKVAAFAGIFPCAMIFLQKLGYIRYNREAELLGSEVYERATGGYADSFSVALPIIIAIFFLLNIIQSNKELKRPQKIYEFLLAGYLVSLVFTFHRMTYVVVAVTIGMWVVFNKRYNYAIIIVIGVVVSFSSLSTFVPDFFGNLGISSEESNTVVVNNQDDGFAIEGSALHGRGWLWTRFMRTYFSAPTMDQLFGLYMAGRAPHNDYIRVLFTVGAFGLTIYMIMLLLIGLKLLAILQYYTRTGDTQLKNLCQTAVFMYVFYMLSSITLTISTLSTMSWYFWVLFGIIAYQYNLAQVTERRTIKQSLVLE